MNADEKPERKPQRGRVDDKFKIFGTANEPLCDEVCAFLGLTAARRRSRASATARLRPDPGECARRRCVCAAADLPLRGTRFDGIAVDDRRAQAGVSAAYHFVIPIFGYARQDRKDKPRVPISAKLVADC